MNAPIRTRNRTIRVEEEFQLIDTATRCMAARARDIAGTRPTTGFTPEMQECVVQSASAAHASVENLTQDLLDRRAALNESAAELGLAIAAAGTVPMASKSTVEVFHNESFRKLSADYGLLAREQLVCGTQIHVEVADRDEALAVAAGISRYLPLLLALSASSPFNSEGQDTGYASSRYLAWARWPTTGSHPPARTSAEYDALVSGLVEARVISGPSMIYYDLRPSQQRNGLELRIADACPSVDTTITIAALFRALVEREAQLDDPTPPLNPAIQRAATWRAARFGMEGDLLDPETSAPRSAREVLLDLVELLRPQLTATGDFERVDALARRAVMAGSSAFRQRRALRRRGRPDDVMDLLVAETASSTDSTQLFSTDEDVFKAYVPIEGVEMDHFTDEAFDAAGLPRDLYKQTVEAATRLGPVGLRTQQVNAERDLTVRGVTFRVTGESHARAFSMDMMPRIIDHSTWRHLSTGAEQRAKAINAFLNDVYGEQAILRDGRLPLDILDKSPGYRRAGQTALRGSVRNHVSGVDLIYSERNGWQILEDNVRMPSGLTFALEARAMSQRNYPELFDTAPAGLNDTSGCYSMFYDTLLAAAPPGAGEDPHIVIASPGQHDPSFFEQVQISEATGIPIVTPDQLVVEDHVAYEVSSGSRRRVDVAYLRQDEEMFLTSRGADGEPLRYPIQSAISAGHLTIANALGNGIGDDKAIYAFVPQMIEYYLGEKPLINHVPTYLCSIREQRDMVIERLDELVVKPIDGYGGSGITIGPEATDEELALRREELQVRPEQFIAQEVVSLSTLPTFEGVSMQPRHVDLRLFTHLRAGSGPGELTAVTAPAGLTRVAPAGSLVVNSSRGGGGKDTWIVVEDATNPSAASTTP
ncbi:carboxylate--amine ligase/circularly permuted type 2 ATP-grasp protein [Corynebacterium heidelbergense]|uniref:Putative glutamate--cysteine ligase 2 n=1 Tax=Corynebacterium heidelbergense TaxID=2055947 RepID=A0A364V5N9_9CORY|nr:carboxylate--amine ligase/circularly permuted type 2 ATP-grasp protein [Corynebacterium heidelbergense]RAV31965.1 carboxylate--amine ligase [Corynebacterium heidelbergense]